MRIVPFDKDGQLLTADTRSTPVRARPMIAPRRCSTAFLLSYQLVILCA